MMTRITFFVCVAALFSQRARSFVVVNNHNNGSTSSLSYAKSAIDERSPQLESFRSSIAKSFQRDEDPMPLSKLLTDQLAREFTTGRRYLLAAGAVKELSEEFYVAEEQQRVRAMELIEYARINDIQLSDYASQIDKTPIDKSMATAEFLQELLLQEQQDMKLLDKAVAQASVSLSSQSNQDAVDFLQSIRSDQVDRQHDLTHLLTHTMPSLDLHSSMSVLDTAATTAAAAATSTTDAAATTVSEIASREHLQSYISNQLQSLGKEFENVLSRTGHVTATGATAATAAVAVDSVDPESLPSTEEILDALPINTEDILQAVDTATAFLEEQSELVDTLQQNIMDTDTLSQLVDIVSGLY